MADIENVIEGLEKAKSVIEAWVPMFEQYNSPFAIDCAIAMLKEQEAVKPVLDKQTGRIWLCGNCGSYVGFEDNDPNDPNEYDKYCRECGKPVLWEGR